jgi:glutathione S-transferase
MTLTLHHSPFACSLASRFALAVSGLPHEIVLVNLGAGAQHDPAYRAINPQGKVPALVTDSGVLTESTAILPYIADLVPDMRLFPEAGTFARAKAQSQLSYLSSTVHAAFTGAFRPERFTTDAAAIEATRATFIDRVGQGLAPLDAHMADREYLLDAFSVCDLYLLVFLTWRGSPAVAGKLSAFANLDQLQQRLLAHPPLAATMGADMQAMAQQSPYSKAQ